MHILFILKHCSLEHVFLVHTVNQLVEIIKSLQASFNSDELKNVEQFEPWSPRFEYEDPAHTEENAARRKRQVERAKRTKAEKATKYKDDVILNLADVPCQIYLTILQDIQTHLAA